MDETFLLSNIAPQVGEGFNRHCELILYDAEARLGVPRGVVPEIDAAIRRRLCLYVRLCVSQLTCRIPLYLPALGPDGKWRVVSV